MDSAKKAAKLEFLHWQKSFSLQKFIGSHNFLLQAALTGQAQQGHTATSECAVHVTAND